MAKVDNKSAYTFDKQPRLVLGAFRLMCVNSAFLKKFAPILSTEYWSEMEGKWVIREVVAHYEEYGRAPRMQTMRMRLDADVKLKDDQEDLIGRFLNKLDAFELDDATCEYIEKHFEGFIRYRATLHALRVANEYLQENDLTAAADVVMDSQRVRLTTDEWHRLPQQADSYFRYFSEDNIQAVSIPIGIAPLDDKLKGGLRRGELGVVVASLGVGKSMALVHFGAAAYRKGKRVAHFTFENSWEETQARYMHNLLEIESDALAKMDADHPVYNTRADIMDGYGGSLLIIELPGNETSAMDIASHLQRLEEMGEFPDLVLVDYADLMKSSRRSSRRSERWQELGAIYEELRQLGADWDVPVWTASQANREGLKSAQGVRTYHVGGAIGKLNVADVVLTISRPQRDAEKDLQATPQAVDDDEIESEYRVWRLSKLRRGGEDGWRITLRAYYACAKFEIVDDAADIDKKVDKAMGNNASH